MVRADGVRVGVTCECGENFDVSVAGLELEKLTFTCPNCGHATGFTTEQVEEIVVSHAKAREGLDQIKGKGPTRISK
jgi:hypothetical protein